MCIRDSTGTNTVTDAITNTVTDAITNAHTESYSGAHADTKCDAFTNAKPVTKSVACPERPDINDHAHPGGSGSCLDHPRRGQDKPHGEACGQSTFPRLAVQR